MAMSYSDVCTVLYGAGFRPVTSYTKNVRDFEWKGDQNRDFEAKHDDGSKYRTTVRYRACVEVDASGNFVKCILRGPAYDKYGVIVHGGGVVIQEWTTPMGAAKGAVSRAAEHYTALCAKVDFIRRKKQQDTAARLARQRGTNIF